MSSVSPTNQDLTNDTTFSQIKSRVPVPLSRYRTVPISFKLGSDFTVYFGSRSGFESETISLKEICFKTQISCPFLLDKSGFGSSYKMLISLSGS